MNISQFAENMKLIYWHLKEVGYSAMVARRWLPDAPPEFFILRLFDPDAI